MMEHYRNTEQGGARVQSLLCDRQVVTELSSDFSLPDYQPEIKRLLRVRATVSPPDKYIGAGSAELSGTVDYSIVYAGNDGALYCTAQTGEYSFSTPVEMASDIELGDGLICDAESVAEVATGRVVAPRKLSLKCRLRSRVRLYGTRIIEENVGGVRAESIRRLKGSAECARVFVGMGEALQLGDEILCDTQAESIRVICADAQVYVSEASAGSGCVNCRGELCVKLVCTSEGEGAVPYVQLRRIPFSQSVLTDGVEINCDCSVRGTCTDMRITVEDGRILCEASVRLETRAQRNETVAFTRDAYSTEAGGECRYTELRGFFAQKCVSGNFSLNTVLSQEETGIRTGQTVVDVSILPTVAELTCERGKYVLTGRCRCHAILCGDGDPCAQEFEIPFRYEADGGDGEVSDYDLTLVPITCRARADGERVSVDAELSVGLMTRGERCYRMLSEATFDAPISRTGAAYTVCYPAVEDTLWSVAKRYHRAIEEIAEMNPLSGTPSADARDSLMGVKYLLV